MIDEIKILLGDAAANHTDTEISLAYKIACAEVEGYCKREIGGDTVLQLVAEQIAVIKLNRKNTEGLSSQSYSGVSESYIDGYPAEIKSVLNSKRKVKFL